MKIGFYDQNTPSGLTGLFLKMKEDGLYVEDLDNLSSIPKELDTIIINPTFANENNKIYWEGIKKIVESNSNKRFLIFIPNFMSSVADYAKSKLGEFSNVKYFTHRGRTNPSPIEQLMGELKLN